MPPAIDNPYRSPRSDDTVVLDAAGRRLTQPIVSSKPSGIQATVIFGAWAGVLFGGLFGVGGSLILGLSQCPLVLGWNQILPPTNFSTETIVTSGIIVTILGALAGIACGLLIGPFIGALAALRSGRFRTTAFYTAIVLSSIAGAVIGLTSSDLTVVALKHLQADQTLLYFAEQAAASPSGLASLIGIVIGGFAGTLGGQQLGRGILNFCD